MSELSRIDSLVAEVHHAARPVEAMLNALHEALQEDLESGAHWMNEAASAEFRRKYPRFCTLLRIARSVKWDEV